MESKREYSGVCRRSSYLLALELVLVLALAFPTLLSASSFYATKNHIFPEFIKWHISIVNALSNNKNLFTHCKSAEDDIGPNNLSSGSNVTWSFRTDFFHSTMFWCHVQKDDTSASFDVFWYDDRLLNKCDWKSCIWVAKDDGIYLKNLSERLDEFYYRWGTGM